MAKSWSICRPADAWVITWCEAGQTYTGIAANVKSKTSPCSRKTMGSACSAVRREWQKILVQRTDNAPDEDKQSISGIYEPAPGVSAQSQSW